MRVPIQIWLLALPGLGALAPHAQAADSNSTAPTAAFAFQGSQPGDRREIAGIPFCWCPPGTFTMGSARNEPERRPDEDQVEVTLTRGFWMAKYETTQGQWKRVMGNLPAR